MVNYYQQGHLIPDLIIINKVSWFQNIINKVNLFQSLIIVSKAKVFTSGGFPGGGFPGGGFGNVNQRLDRLERQIERLDRRIDQLDRRVDRIERRFGIRQEDYN